MPMLPDDANMTIPLGWYPDTVATQEEDVLPKIEDGEQPTEVVVELLVATSEDKPVLFPLFTSPP